MRLLTMLLGAAALAWPTDAQVSRPSAPAGRDAPPLHRANDVPAKQLALRIGLDREQTAPGGVMTLIVAVTPRPRMHVYAPGEAEYIPIDLALDRGPRFAAPAPTYPPATTLLLAAVRQRVKVYDAPFRIAQRITVAATPETAALVRARQPLTVSGTLTYQACDDSVCYRPESVALRWDVPLGE